MPRDTPYLVDPGHLPVDQVFEPHYSPVPYEFRGLARVTHGKLREADLEFKLGLLGLIPMLKARLGQHKLRLRPEHIAAVKRGLNVGMIGQRADGLVIDNNKRGFKILVGRLSATQIRGEHWDTAEDGVLLNVHEMRPDRRQDATHYWYAPLWTVATVCHFGWHSMARFYQRSFANSEEDLFAAMWHLHSRARAILERCEETEDRIFAVPVPAAGGIWRGELCHFPIYDTRFNDEDDRISVCLNVKTFTPEGSSS